MGILTRYLIRAHAGPFFFALAALTGLLFLNAVAQRLQDLAGKGLTADIIVEFLVLSLPHTVALTLPMAILVSVLYAFSDLTANSEIMAMNAGGIRPQRLLVPLLGVGTILALLMFVFNDRILPEANHRLKNLIVDISRKSPTLTLREQVVNRIELSEAGERVFLQASRIDNTTNALYDVVIWDMNDLLRYRVTVADSGSMMFNETQTDLYMVLYDGAVYETGLDPPGSFSQVQFQKQTAPFRGVGTEMERQVTGGARSDREMTLAMLSDVANERLSEADRLREENRERSRNAVLFALGYEVDDPDVFASASLVADRVALTELYQDPGPVGPPTGAVQDHVTRRLAVATRQSQNVVAMLTLASATYRVEIHKKYSLAVACLVFVLLGAPVAVRYPGGGLGMVIAVSSSIFAVYWVGLIGGENLADRGLIHPAVGMWFPNVTFALLGLLLVRRMGREAASMRGGDWDELLFTLREGAAAPFRRRRRARRLDEQRSGAA